MAKGKKKRSGKADNPAKSPPPRASDKLKKEGGAEDFGGMNVENFKRNLGCG